MNCSPNHSRTGFCIVGTHIKSEGYPNVKIRTDWLHRILDMPEINVPAFDPDSHRRKERWSPRYSTLLAKGLRFAYAHLHVLLEYFLNVRAERIYVPYPAVPLLYLFSLVPRRYRPKVIVVDAFISLYDTIVADRAMVPANGLVARSIKKIETRAYEVASLVIADTNLNTSYLSETFEMPRHKLLSIPLSIDETIFRPIPYFYNEQRDITVLFVGTFVPLQGVTVIARAAKILKNCPQIHFRLVGCGQSAAEVEEILSSYESHNVFWDKNWKSGEQLSLEIEGSDICLGIFGEGEKAQRVWPLKNYSYMAVGRAIITGDTLCSRDLRSKESREPFMAVPPGDPEALAEAILKLAQNHDLRKTLAHEARVFFENHLSSRISENMLTKLFLSYPLSGGEHSSLPQP